MFFIRNLRVCVGIIGIIAAIAVPWLVNHWPELTGKKEETRPAVSAPSG